MVGVLEPFVQATYAQEQISEQSFKRNREAIKTAGRLALQLSKTMESLEFERFHTQNSVQFRTPVPPHHPLHILNPISPLCAWY